jgi:ribosomal protein S18 acetylase RimI-like enzyme
MKINEPFNPDIKSVPVPKDVTFQVADETHIQGICHIVAERNPLDSIESIKKKTEREISLNLNDLEYRLFVATIGEEVIGLCRFYHSRGLPKEKIKFASPEGWYAMGILVSQEHRRKNIARFLFQERLKVLKKFNAQSLYSIVDANNETSIKMHQEFGFEEISRAEGFLHLSFQNDGAILFKYWIE